MIIITNEGKLDLNGLRLFGASSKRGETGKIGFFGSGAKYAIAWLLRNNVFFQLWIDGEEVPITTKKVEMRGTEYDEIVINGIDASITTETGPKWQAWMCIRELYANAIDEGGEMAITNKYDDFIKPGRTTFIIEENELFKELLNNQDYYFARGRKVVYENDRIKVYDKHHKGAGFYLNGVLVSASMLDNFRGFGYQMKLNPFLINEERSIIHLEVAKSMMVGGIMTIDDKDLVSEIVGMIKTPSKNDDMYSLERSCFADYMSSAPMEVGAYEKAMLQSDHGRSYPCVPGYDSPSRTSMAWRKYKAYTIIDEEKFAHVPFSVLMHNTISGLFGVDRFENSKWASYNDAVMEEKMEKAFQSLKELVPELGTEVPAQNPFKLGTSVDSKITIESWKGASWYNYSSAMVETSHEIMVKMFTYLMIDSGSHGQKIAAMMLMDRIKQKSKQV